MSNSIRYQGGQGVGLESFGIQRATPGDSRESLANMSRLDALVSAAARQQEQGLVADYAEQGAQANLARDANGQLIAPTLYENTTAAGRAYNAAAIKSVASSVLVDADRFARETLNRIENEQVMVDGKPAGRKSVDMIGDWDKSWDPYVSKTMSSMPDQMRALVQDEIEREGLKYRNGLVTKQSNEAIDRDVQDLTAAAGRYGTDALTFAAMPGKENEAKEASAKYLAQLDAIQLRGGARVDRAKIADMRLNFETAKTGLGIYTEAKGLIDAEFAKSPDTIRATLAKATALIDSKEIPKEQKTVLAANMAAYVDRLAGQRNEAQELAAIEYYRTTLPGLAAEAAKISVTGTGGLAKAGQYLLDSIAGVKNPKIQARVTEMATSYLVAGGKVPSLEETQKVQATLDAYRRGWRDESQLFEDVGRGNLGPDGIHAGLAIEELTKFRKEGEKVLAPIKQAARDILTASAEGVTAPDRGSILTNMDKLSDRAIHPNGDVLQEAVLDLFGDERQRKNFIDTIVGVRGIHGVGAAQITQVLQGKAPTDPDSMRAQLFAAAAIVNAMDNPTAGAFDASKLSAIDQARLRSFATNFGNTSFINELFAQGPDGEARQKAARASMSSFYAETQKLKGMSKEHIDATLKNIWGDNYQVKMADTVTGSLKDMNYTVDILGFKVGGISDKNSFKRMSGDERVDVGLFGHIVSNPIDSAFRAIQEFPVVQAWMAGFTDKSPAERTEIFRQLTTFGTGMDIVIDPAIKDAFIEQLKATSLSSGEAVAATTSVRSTMKNGKYGPNIYTLNDNQLTIEKEPIAMAFGDDMATRAALRTFAVKAKEAGLLGEQFGSVDQSLDAFDYAAKFSQYGPNGERIYTVTAIVKNQHGLQQPIVIPKPLVVPSGSDMKFNSVRAEAEAREAKKISEERIAAGSASTPEYGGVMSPEDMGRGSVQRFSTAEMDRARIFAAGSSAVFEHWMTATMDNIASRWRGDTTPPTTSLPRPTVGLPK